VTKHDKVVEKVKKLLRLADKRGGGTPAEIALAAARAKELMDQHSIETAEISVDDDVTRARVQMEMEMDSAYAWIGLRDYMNDLGHVVASITTTAFLVQDRPSKYKYGGVERWTTKTNVCFLGDKTDVAVACAVYKILIKSCHSWVKKEIGPGYGKRQRCYCEGFVSALWIKVNRIQPNTEETGLVLHNKRDQINKFMEEKMNVESKEISRTRGGEDAVARWEGFQRGLDQSLETNNLVE
jgi:hypothetical protein